MTTPAPDSLIGIDPGKSGGIAVYRNGEMTASKMPDTHKDLFEMLRLIKEESVQPVALLEKVHSMPGQGVRSVFTFGEGYGSLRMALTATAIPYDTCTPQKWQKALGCLTKGDKNVSKAKAQELFPALKITHAIADAILICEHLRRMRGID
jgi:Holliday junction resolvasome RuvABC endonuclease subunit